MTRMYAFATVLWLLAGSALAQSLTKQADRQFDQLAYAKAVDLYEQALNRSATLPENERRTAQAHLAYSYYQMRDMKNAERVYHELMAGGELPTELSPHQLYYAQALASNGKYKEAREAYEVYNKLQPEDIRAARFSRLYGNVNTLARNADSYKVDFLKLNTRKAEFSPMVYKDGLVYVSTGEPNGVKRVFNWNSTAFLNLYYVPEAKALRVTKAAKVGGAAPSPGVKRVSRSRLFRPLGSDDYTASTANDSRTVGFFGGNNVNAGLGYAKEPVSQEIRFGRTLNTKYHEGPTTFSRDGSRVIFTRNNYNNGEYRQSTDGINKLKLYTAVQVDGFWGPAEELPFNSDEYSTGHPTLSPDEKRLYFASDRPGGYGGTDIYVSEWADGAWSQPINLGKEINSKGNELFPFMDDKGGLYVASDGHAGLGGLDIFYTQMTDNGRLAVGVRNLGEPLNSPKDDFGIVTDGDRQNGYFSSNRKHGGADDDLYRFSRVGSMYPCRELMLSVFDAETKQPLANTSITVDNGSSGQAKTLKTNAQGLTQVCIDADNDVNFVASREGYVDNKVGLSTRYQDDDQPSRLDIPLGKPKLPATVNVQGVVTAQNDKTPIEGVKVLLINECDGSSQETVTGADGSYAFTIPTGCDYSLEAVKDKMGTSGSRITKEGTGPTNLTMFKKGDVMTIDNIYYDVNKADIRPDAALELDKVIALLTKYPTMRIEMRSHTDSRATTQYNKTLSANRAKSAVTYLKAKGISAKRMVAKGYGESLLLNKCKDGVDCADEEHQQNRRTEIKVLQL